jgi:hypothetical protein
MKPTLLIKDLLGELPFTAEAYWLLRHRDKKIRSRFNLEPLATRIPELVAQLKPHAGSVPTGKKTFLFASLHYWIEHTALTGLALRGLGHDVTLGYLPYSDFLKPIARFDLRRHDLYTRHVLRGLSPFIKAVSFLDLEAVRQLPEALAEALEQVTMVDTQYILQRETVTGSEPICQFRRERNVEAARLALAYFQKSRPDVVVIPNGMIQEFGAVYETARYLDILTVTYEFFEIDQRAMIAQNDLVMLHPTSDLWPAYQNRKLDKDQRAWLESFLAARQGDLFQKISREGKERIRSLLHLDNRPVILLPTNVVGDTATLGRTRSLFSNSMADWLVRVVRFFLDHPEVQLVIRFHPAEAKLTGPSVAEALHQAFPDLPEHIHLIGARDKVNTYDVIEITDLALVYTTSAGLEMTTRGIPVFLSGSAHYRKKGFTIDADTWEEYIHKLEAALKDLPAQRLSPEQIEQAWNYAYFYYHDYPRPFPWHVEKIGPSLESRPLGYVLSPAGRAEYESTFQQLAGAPMV